MKRIELFEFEDFKWLPNVIRTGVTNLITVFHRMMGTSTVLTNLILEVQQKYTFNQITDLGSGSGGPMLEVIQNVNQANPTLPMQLVLTDLYPNPNLVAHINQQDLKHVKYHTQSVNATNISEAPSGLKTMVGSFHHMPPTVAKKILHAAQDNREPILIYEVAKNNIPVLVWTLFLPLSLVILIVMSLVLTLFVRPFSFKQVFFTYLIPIIPLVYAWDGQASLMRTYTFEDIQAFLDENKTTDYHWSIGDAKKGNGKNAGYYIMGYPLK